MNNIITTKTIGSGIAEVEEDFILSEEPMSRLVFRAQIHKKGIRGKIIRQRRESKDDKWIPDKSIDIRSLGKNEYINLNIDTHAVKELYLAISKLANILKEKGVEYGENKYAIVDPDKVIITEENKLAYIQKIINAGYEKEIWEMLSEHRPSLVKKLSHFKIQNEKEVIVQELKNRLGGGPFSETKGDNSWQKWIYKNNWLFGINYQSPIEKAKINISGIMPDFLFPTLDGFIDMLEIKLPNDDVIIQSTTRNGCWRWTQSSNEAIGQVVNYLCEIDRNRLDIEKIIKNIYKCEISLLKPRAYILIGDSSNWPNDKKEGLRKLNHFLHGIEILTYKDLLDRGMQAINISNININ